MHMEFRLGSDVKFMPRITGKALQSLFMSCKT